MWSRFHEGLITILRSDLLLAGLGLTIMKIPLIILLKNMFDARINSGKTWTPIFLRSKNNAILCDREQCICILRRAGNDDYISIEYEDLEDTLLALESS